MTLGDGDGDGDGDGGGDDITCDHNHGCVQIPIGDGWH